MKDDPPRGHGYRQIAADLRADIIGGKYRPGDEIPSYRELVKTYGVADLTARRATDVLKTEGLVHADRQRLVVRDTHPPVTIWMTHTDSAGRRHGASTDAFVTDLRDQGREPSQTIDVAIVAADHLIADRLELDPGTTVAARRRVRHADGQPLDVNDSYYPYELVQGTEVLTPGDVGRGIGNVLRELGHEQVRFVDEITTRTAADDERRRLDVPAGTPVIEHVRTGYTAARPIRVTITVVPGDRVRLLYEVDA